jgi:hypothetical protein
VSAALSRLGLQPVLEAPVADGLFSADVALTYRGQQVVVEVCGPTHFLVPAAPLLAGRLGRVASSGPEELFSDALVVAAAGEAAGTAAAAGARGATALFPGGGSSASGGGGGKDGGGLLLLKGPQQLRTALLEALGWRVAVLPFHAWLMRGSDGELLQALLDQAVGAPPSGGEAVSGRRQRRRQQPADSDRGSADDGGDSGRRAGTGRRRSAVAAEAARRVQAAARRGRERAQEQATAAAAAAADATASVTALLGGIEQASKERDGASGIETFDFDLDLDLDGLTSLTASGEELP